MIKFNPNLADILIIVSIFGIIISYITYRLFKLKLYAALSIGIFLAFGLLNVMYPIGYLMYQRNSILITIYILIEIVVPIYLFVLLFYLLITNQRRETNKDQDE